MSDVIRFDPGADCGSVVKFCFATSVNADHDALARFREKAFMAFTTPKPGERYVDRGGRKLCVVSTPVEVVNVGFPWKWVVFSVDGQKEHECMRYQDWFSSSQGIRREIWDEQAEV